MYVNVVGRCRAHCCVHRFIESLLSYACQSEVDESHKWFNSGALCRMKCKGQHKAPTTGLHKQLKGLHNMYTSKSKQNMFLGIGMDSSQATYNSIMYVCTHLWLLLTCTNTVKIVRPKMAATCCSLREHSFSDGSGTPPLQLN